MDDKTKADSFGDEDNNPFSQTQVNEGGEEESMLLYETNSNGTKSNGNVTTEGINSVQINYESRVSKLLKPGSNVKIQITEANNSSEGMVNSSKKYIAYTIKLVNIDNPKEEIQIRRRYSDFESLRSILSRIFPLLIIPPIPPKNYFNFSMLNNLVGTKTNGNAHATNPSPKAENVPINSNSSDYSYINSTHLNSIKLIEHRKRLLSNFLNNCLNISKIRNLEFFAKFLDPNTNWQDEINLVTSQLPKSIYHSNPENGLKTDDLYSNLPNITGNSIGSTLLKPLQNNKLAKKTTQILGNGSPAVEEPEIESGEEVSNGSSETVNDSSDTKPINTSNIDDINKKIMDNFIGLATDYTELGTVFNSFSLILSDSPIIRASKLKQEPDQEGGKLNIILDKMGQVFDRSYITINSLINDLETKFSEPLGEEVQYSSILNFIQKFQTRKLRQKSMLDTEIQDKKQTLQELLKAEEEAKTIESVSNKANTPKPNEVKGNSKFKMFPNMNSIKKITQYVSDIIDQNPQQTRKQRISDLQVKIVTLEKCQGIMLEDISYIADELNKNFKLFHNKQLKVIYEILLCYNGYLVTWAKKNVEIWEEIRGDIINL